MKPYLSRTGSAVLSGLIVAAFLFAGPLWAQQDDGERPIPAQSQGTQPNDNQEPANVSSQTDTTTSSQDGSNADSAGVGDQEKPRVISLESGLPLRVVTSPLHWGHLSLLSAGLMGSYFKEPSLTSQYTFFNGLVVYAIQHHRSQLDLQYMPMVWATNGKVRSNLTSQAVDASYSSSLGRYWTLNLTDQFSYSPNQSYWTSSSFSPDFASGTSTTQPFFLLGRTALFNNFGVQVNHQLDARNQLGVAVTSSFVRLSQNAIGGNPVTTVGSDSTPAGSPFSVDEQLDPAASVTWAHTISSRSSFNVLYSFQYQYDLRNNARNTFQSAGVGYTSKLRPSITISLQAEPTWSRMAGSTVQGSANLFKAFRNGGIAFSAMRSTSFSGLISNSYNNRYDVSLSRVLLRRIEGQIGYGYIQQSFIKAKQANGGMAFASVGYRLTPSWTVNSTYYYLNYSGSQMLSSSQSLPGGGLVYSPMQVLSAGIRWSWSPGYARGR